MPSPAPSPASPLPTTTTKSALMTSALESAVSVSIVSVSVSVAVTVAMPVAKFPDGTLVLVVGMFPLCWERLLVTLLLNLDSWLFQARLPFWMCTLGAVWSTGAEASEVVGAHLLADMFLGAPGPERAEALLVMWAGWQLALGVDMQIQALVAVGAEAVAQEKVALGHLPQVELVQELAALALFAQATQPVLADERVERVAAILLAAAAWDGDVALGAACSEGAVAIDVGLT